MPSARRLPLVLLAAALGLAGCNGAGDEAPAALPRAVSTVLPGSAPAQPPITAIGRLQLREELQLSFRVPGIIDRIAVRAGDDVRAGQRLAALVDTEVEAQLDQARANLAKAERDHARGQRLAAEAVIPQQQLDDLATALDVARAEVERARFNHRHAFIDAPSDGVILRRLAEASENVAAGQPVLALGSLDSGFILSVALPEHDLPRLRLGAPAEVRVDAADALLLAGRVVEISGQADPRTATFAVDIAVEPPADDGLRLASGMVGRARIAVAGDNRLASVPLRSLVNSGDGTQIFVVEGERVAALPVTVRWFDDEQAALAEALPAALRVVDRGAGFLRHGDAVRVVD